MKISAILHKRRVPMEQPIPLDRPAKRKLEKGDYLVYKLRNDPADDLTIPYFREGTPEHFLQFRKIIQKVFTEQNRVCQSFSNVAEIFSRERHTVAAVSQLS
jgi:hypothetical protein